MIPGAPEQLTLMPTSSAGREEPRPAIARVGIASERAHPLRHHFAYGGSVHFFGFLVDHFAACTCAPLCRDRARACPDRPEAGNRLTTRYFGNSS